MENLFSLQTNMTPTAVKSQLPVLLDMIVRWPSSKRFPVLDLIRVLASKFPAEIAVYRSGELGIADLLLESAELQEGVMLGRRELELNAMLVLRTLANLFGAEEGRSLVTREYQKV